MEPTWGDEVYCDHDDDNDDDDIDACGADDANVPPKRESRSSRKRLYLNRGSKVSVRGGK
jgi:hypothetical protein